MNQKKKEIPDSTAVRVALWRALHVENDAPPHVLHDTVGLKLVAPAEGWRSRPDMHPQGTAPFRASIVARARFIEDFIGELVTKELSQYVILGSGLDTFAQRKPEVASKLNVFEVDQPETIEWKKKRLEEEGYPIPSWLHLVPVDFESGVSWWEMVGKAGLDEKRPVAITSIGVTMYLTMDAIKEMFEQMLKLAPGSKFIVTFMLPLELVNPEDQAGYQMAIRGAQNSETPFISFFSPAEMLKFAQGFGFKKVEHFSTSSFVPKYFSGRADGLRPSTGEEFLIVTI